MSQKAVEGLLGRLITDKEFRDRFYEEPAATCGKEGFELTTRELEAVLGLEEARVAEFSKCLDAKIVRAGMNGTRPPAGQPTATDQGTARMGRSK